MQRYRSLFIGLLFCCAAQFLAGQERSLEAEITPAWTLVRNDEIFTVTTVVRNVGTKEQSLTVWTCFYPGQWMTDNRNVHLVVVPCTRNKLEVRRLKPGESFSKPLSLYIDLPSGHVSGTKVNFRLGYRGRSYSGKPSFSPKLPLFWSNASTVVVSK